METPLLESARDWKKVKFSCFSSREKYNLHFGLFPLSLAGGSVKQTRKLETSSCDFQEFDFF